MPSRWLQLRRANSDHADGLVAFMRLKPDAVAPRAAPCWCLALQSQYKRGEDDWQQDKRLCFMLRVTSKGSSHRRIPMTHPPRVTVTTPQIQPLDSSFWAPPASRSLPGRPWSFLSSFCAWARAVEGVPNLKTNYPTARSSSSVVRLFSIPSLPHADEASH